jgi:hypothetical protein
METANLLTIEARTRLAFHPRLEFWFANDVFIRILLFWWSVCYQSLLTINIKSHRNISTESFENDSWNIGCTGLTKVQYQVNSFPSEYKLACRN